MKLLPVRTVDLRPPTFAHFKSLLMLKWAPKEQHLIGKIWDRLDYLVPQGTIGELLALDERDFVAGGLSPDEAQQSED